MVDSLGGQGRAEHWRGKGTSQAVKQSFDHLLVLDFDHIFVRKVIRQNGSGRDGRQGAPAGRLGLVLGREEAG